YDLLAHEGDAPIISRQHAGAARPVVGDKAAAARAHRDGALVEVTAGLADLTLLKERSGDSIHNRPTDDRSIQPQRRHGVHRIQSAVDLVDVARDAIIKHVYQARAIGLTAGRVARIGRHTDKHIRRFSCTGRVYAIDVVGDLVGEKQAGGQDVASVGRVAP